ncbi:FHA domain-containing protein [Paenibacillus validus]|uniref:FHA domain-containing protein n=1 Tax=Paenibacillus validus TaxID=44253 RepID=A0A7X3CQG6_9BACL|nr:DUF6382 domain-containing protein [Paenibacillus validus]MUG69625.1 FHA domain-containing protein [Paenibacillus validus]
MNLTQSIYGLQVDYKKQQGHFMTLTAPEGLKQEELSEFQLRMVSANRIPKLLELQVEAKDARLTLFYNITGKRMLTQGLRIEPLSLKQYYGLLLQIVEVLDDSGVYMLQPGRYLLKEDFIFYGFGLDDLYLTYVPKEHLDGKASVSTDLQHLASRWIHRVVELQGNGFQEVMRYLQEETFNLPELKRLLLRQLEHPPGSAAAAGPSAVIQEMMEAGASSAVRPDLVPPAPPLFKETPWGDEAVIPVPDKSEKQPFEPLKKRLFLLLGAVLVLCFVWKLYAENPNEQKLYLSAGSTVFLGAALLWGYRRMGRERGYERPGSIELGSAGVLAPKAEEEAARHAFLSRAGLVEELYTPVDDRSTLAEPDGYAVRAQAWDKAGDNPIWSSAWNKNEAGDYALQSSSARNEAGHVAAGPSLWQHSSVHSELSGRTTLLLPSDATVLLGPPQAGIHVKMPYLEVSRSGSGGSLERIDLSKPSFVIGRQGAEADWVIEEAGVSRLHAEFVKEPDGYAVKDLGSRNGTWLNGELLVPYQTHPLREGDIVKIISTEIIYKI